MRNATTHIRPNVVITASCSSFRDNREQIFPAAEAGGGAGGINANCSRPEVADDVISGNNVDF